MWVMTMAEHQNAEFERTRRVWKWGLRIAWAFLVFVVAVRSIAGFGFLSPKAIIVPLLVVLSLLTALANSRPNAGREQLLRRYRDIEKKLQAGQAAGRKKCAFLSLKVVGSAEMKIGEKNTQIGKSFEAFDEMLGKIFRQYGAWKQTGTPASVMVCFLDHSLAVAAAQRIMVRLKEFNETTNLLRTPFRVRCGLGLGEAALWEDSRLEKVMDPAIDVARDMQEHARPNSLWLAVEAFETLPDKGGFKLTDAVVDGHPVYEWAPEAGES